MKRILAPTVKKDPLRPFPEMKTETSSLVYAKSGKHTIELSEGRHDLSVQVARGVSVELKCSPVPDAKWIDSHLHIQCAQDAYVDYFLVAEGGKRISISIQCDLAGRGSGADIHSVLHGISDAHHGLQTVMHHMQPDTHGNIIVRGVYEQASRAIFSGLIKIAPDAQRTNSYFQDDVLLADNAFAESLPTLEIEANDVRASHGSTTSRIDSEQLFYLQSRGLSGGQARQMIIDGFLGKLTAEDIAAQ